MEKAKIEKIAKEYFAKNEKTENVYILANGLIFTNERTAKSTAIRLNLQKPFHFANILTPAPLEGLEENKADAKAKKGTSKPK